MFSWTYKCSSKNDLGKINHKKIVGGETFSKLYIRRKNMISAAELFLGVCISQFYTQSILNQDYINVCILVR